jgi:hypothetical protein
MTCKVGDIESQLHGSNLIVFLDTVVGEKLGQMRREADYVQETENDGRRSSYGLFAGNILAFWWKDW